MNTSTYYFFVKTKILTDFQTFISVSFKVANFEHIGGFDKAGNQFVKVSFYV